MRGFAARAPVDVPLPSARTPLRVEADRFDAFLTRLPCIDVSDDEAPADDACVGAAVGPYRLLGPLGKGGMAAVWLAERTDVAGAPRVALKLPCLAWGPGVARRMERERRIGLALRHPRIARLIDAGVDAHGRPWLAFEHVDGVPLDAWREAAEPSLDACLAVFADVAAAVAHAHAAGVLHRDLKPQNVLVSAAGRATLLDFGIARPLDDRFGTDAALTRELGRVLSPRFASPEQLRGEPAGVASDVWSLGVLLYMLLTGRWPFDPARESIAAIEEAILEGRPFRASRRVADARRAAELRGGLDAILARALRSDPSARYPSVAAFAADVARNRTVSARTPARKWRDIAAGWLHRASGASRARAAGLHPAAT